MTTKQASFRIKDPKDTNILLTASLGTNGDTMRFLLSQGRRPSDVMNVSFYPAGRSDTQPVWMVLLRAFGIYVRVYCSKRRDNLDLQWRMDKLWRIAEVLEAHLQAGADHNVYFIIQRSWRSVIHCRAELYEMLGCIKPPNLSRLQKLLCKIPSWKDWIRKPWSAGSYPDPEYGNLPFLTTEELLDKDFFIAGVATEQGHRLMGEFRVGVY